MPESLEAAGLLDAVSPRSVVRLEIGELACIRRLALGAIILAARLLVGCSGRALKFVEQCAADRVMRRGLAELRRGLAIAGGAEDLGDGPGDPSCRRVARYRDAGSSRRDPNGVVRLVPT